MNSTLPATTGTASVRFAVPQLPAARVLHQVRTTEAAHPCDRQSISEALGMSRATVTRHISTLIDADLITQKSVHDDTRPGRPRSVLTPGGRHLTTWGAHVGLHTTQIVVADGAGRIIRRRDVRLSVADSTPESVISTIADELTRLGDRLTAPVGVGVALSADVNRAGFVSSTAYGWDQIPFGALLSERIGHPVHIASGVSAMAAHELYSTPLPHVDPSVTASGSSDSTLYFYARELVGHAWIFHGAVHRPLTGIHPRSFSPDGESDAPPVSSSGVLAAARAQGLAVKDIDDLVRVSSSNTIARRILDERALALGRAISLAVDVVDPESLVFAGEAFTSDRRGVQLIASMLRKDLGGDRKLSIQRAGSRVVTDAARTVALHGLWTDPLGTAEGLHQSA